MSSGEAATRDRLASGKPRVNAPALIAKINVKGLLFPVAILVLLEGLAVATGFKRDSIALPSAFLTAFFASLVDGTIAQLTYETLSATFGGVLLGGAIGLTLGVLMGVSRLVFNMLDLTVEVIRPIPSVSLIPIALLVLGFGYAMEISLIAKASMWPILILTQAAIWNLQPRYNEISRLLELGLIERVRKVIIPAVMPSIFVGFRLSMGVALLVSITIEIAVNPRGLGYAMMRAEETLRPDILFALVLWVGLLGWALNALLLFLQHRLFDQARPGGKFQA